MAGKKSCVFSVPQAFFFSSKMTKHNKDIHKGVQNQFGDEIITVSPIKVIHGNCTTDKLFQDKQKILSLALEIFCKTPNESIIECIGSVAELHTKPQFHSQRVKTSLKNQWVDILDQERIGIFKTESSNFFVSQVVARINAQSSRITFME